MTFAYNHLVRSRTYFQITEVYDAHVLLIESDDYYLKDKQLDKLIQKSDTKDKELCHQLFKLRAENIQRIHALPEKILGILARTKVDDDLIHAKTFGDMVDVLHRVKGIAEPSSK